MEVTSIQNGIIIDHVPAGTALKVLEYLKIDPSKTKLALIMNTDSHMYGTKDIIKIEDETASIDLDVLDPSCFPGTGTPEAGGVRFTDLLSAALRTIRGCRIVGCDMVELSPPLDTGGDSTATALKHQREMLLALEKPYIQE